MKLLALLMAALAVGLLWSLRPHARPARAELPCGLVCANAVSAALWDALMTVDCDNGYDLSDTTCQDDLNDVHKAPAVDSVTPLVAGRVRVRLRLFETTGLVDVWSDTVSANGVVVRAVEHARYRR